MRRTASHIAITTAMALGLTALATTAGAQQRLTIPQGVTNDRFNADSWAVSLDFGMTNFDGNEAISFAGRFDMYGQILADIDVHRAGGYASIPYARIEGDSEDDSVSKLGHLELGGLFATPLGATTDAVLRGGFAFEVSPEEDGSLESLALAFTGFGRLSEVVISVPDTSWARLSGSLLHRSDPYFFRGDLGLDLPFSDGEDDPFFRLNLAAGIDFDTISLLAELANLATFTDSDEDEIVSTIAFTMRIPTATFSPAIGVVFPIDDEIQELVDFVLVVGVHATSGVGN